MCEMRCAKCIFYGESTKRCSVGFSATDVTFVSKRAKCWSANERESVPITLSKNKERTNKIL